MTKTPTVSGVSRRLAAAGFRRSERQIGGYGSGYVAEKTEGAVRVRHRFWSMGGGDAAPRLAEYAQAITAAGWMVRTENDPLGRPCLIVTAKADAGRMTRAERTDKEG